MSSFPNAEYSQPSNSPTPLPVTLEKEPLQHADDGETRCWHYSPETLRDERELLKKYHADDFRGLLNETHIMLIGLVKLMQNINPNTRVKGCVIISVAKLLGQVSTLILRTRNVYGNVKQV